MLSSKKNGISQNSHSGVRKYHHNHHHKRNQGKEDEEASPEKIELITYKENMKRYGIQLKEFDDRHKCSKWD